MIKEILKIKKNLKIKNVFNISRSNTSINNKEPKDYESFKKFLYLARFEMDKNGLFDWKLELDHAKVRAGACFFSEKKSRFQEISLKIPMNHKFMTQFFMK